MGYFFYHNKAIFSYVGYYCYPNAQTQGIERLCLL